jgi:hypothetical protein
LMLVLASIANLVPQPTLVRPGKLGIFLRLRERRGRQPTKE